MSLEGESSLLLDQMSVTFFVFSLFCGSAVAFTPTPNNVKRASAVAFTPVGIRETTFQSDKTVMDMPGIQAPIGFFDPVGFSETASPEAMLWFRAAELKVC